MLHLTFVLNVLVTIISAMGTFLQYHYLTKNCSDLTKEITTSITISNFFSILSLSLPLVISHLVSSARFSRESLQEAVKVKIIYEKFMYAIIPIIILVGLLLGMIQNQTFGLLFTLFSISMLFKNILYARLGFFNGYGWIVEENTIKLLVGVFAIATSMLLSPYGAWLVPAVQLLILVILNFWSRIKIKKDALGVQASVKDLSSSTIRSVRNHLLISIPGYFIFNMNILISSHFLEEKVLKSFVKNIYLVQGFVTVIASSVRIIARNFNVFFTQNRQHLLQQIVNFYCKVTILFLPAVLFIFSNSAPDFFSQFLSLREFINPIVLILFIMFICIECYQVALTGMSYAVGKTEYHRITWVSVLLGVTFNYLFVTNWGINGAIMALVLSQQITCNTVNFIKFKKEFKLNLLFNKDILLSAVFFLPMLAIIVFDPQVKEAFMVLLICAVLSLFLITYKNIITIKKADLNDVIIG